jgi:hypothetical protein
LIPTGNARRLLGAFAIASLLGAVSTIACATRGSSTFVETEDAGPPPGPPPPAFVDSGDPSFDEFPECAEETQQIYVLGSNKGLYRFYPATATYTHVGQLGCPSGGGTFSMAIDRRGVAWVVYTDGRLFQVDTHDAKCKATSFQPGQTGFETFGMGYSLNDADAGAGETLFVSGAGLAALDTKSLQLQFRGSLTFGRTELTGLGHELYAFSVGSGVVARLNKSTGATELTYRSTAIDPVASFAFAHWGGEFWLFTNDLVRVYSPTTDSTRTVLENTGIHIVGAGSSTCAPIKPPA